ncbi:MAG: ABC transporter permease [Tannerellaceae bacterium]|nr:ABC transporter permease [Tannerellaceae bacterium]
MIKYLIEKEFKQILRNSVIPRMVIGMTIMMIAILPWAADFEIKNIHISVVDKDHSTISSRLIRKIESSGYFKLVQVTNSTQDAMKLVESNESDLILEIQPDFEKTLIREGIADVMISANAVNNTKGGLGSSYLTQILGDFATDIRGEWSQTSGIVTPSVQIASQNRFNQHLNYKVFMVPGLMVMLLTMLGGFLPALNIVGEKEKGTIEQINVTPVGKFTFILAKLIPYWVMLFIVLSLAFLLAFLVYGLVPVGHYSTIYLMAGIYVFTITGFGLLVSNFSSTMQQAMFVMYFFVVLLLLMSGLFTPITSMPQWAQDITLLNPMRYFIQAIRMIFLKGSGLHELSTQLGALSLFAFLFNAMAIISYRKSS